MPNARGTSAALQRYSAEKRQRERVVRIIQAALSSAGMDCRMLSQETEIEYGSLCRRIRAECDFSLLQISRIANALDMDEQTRAALCGSKTKCRFETGYKI